MKTKGSKAERELVKMFWAANWGAIRVAGSGLARFPCPDVVASKGDHVLAVECKSTKKNQQYIEDKQMQELKKFASIFGAKPIIGVRFDREAWVFFDPEDFKQTKKCKWVINKKNIKDKGKFFSDLTK